MPLSPRRLLAGARRGPAPIVCGLLAVLAVAVLIVGLLTITGPPGARTESSARTAPTMAPPTDERVQVKAEPDGTAVDLDVSVFAPGDGGRHPAVVLAHGFGGSKADLTGQAQTLVERGYVVLTYTARGFGVSGGRIHLDAPDYEVDDARRLLDHLAGRADVQLDASGDPRVGVVGGSYGGALALMTAGTDPRVDAIVPSVTWHDLAEAFFPQHALGVAEPGPFQQVWASRFFAGVVSDGAGQPVQGPCGRFDPSVCRVFLPAANTGEPNAELLELLRAHSPARTNAQVRAPTLLIQGSRDSLFGLEHADATYRELQRAGVPVAMRWTDGGHDGASTTQTEDDAAATAWLDRYLTDAGRAGNGLPVAAFSYTGVVSRGADTAPIFTLGRYPGLFAAPSSLALADSSRQSFVSPPGAAPASTIAVPGGEELLPGEAAYRLAALPRASGAWDTAPVPRRIEVVGAPRVRLVVTSTTEDATLYLSLWQVNNDVARLPRALSAPVSVPVRPGRPTEVTVALPAGSWTMEAGSRWRVLVTSTDSSYASPDDARGYTVQPVGALEVPSVSAPVAAATEGPDVESWGVLAAIAVLLAVTAVGAWWARRRRVALPGGDPSVTLSVRNLVKTYRDGHRAVDDVSFEARCGQVVGLLGPNGAGKTTTLRMVMGLIGPTSGVVHVLGRPVYPGSEVLGEVGALVEGPGFLPHLTGRQNLDAYWAATGRPREEAHVEEALEVAALGDAIERPVRSYSHGMRQRLGVAQAMLGLPDLLILDEPTNGLDPPQIAAMRPVLRAYAETGRTVVVSSHLLAEVELTCSHVVVMDRGRVIIAGSVEELTRGPDGSRRRHLEEVFLGVIADSQGAATGPEGEGMDVDVVVERLRRVRSR